MWARRRPKRHQITKLFVRFSFADGSLVSENQLSRGKILANQRSKKEIPVKTAQSQDFDCGILESRASKGDSKNVESEKHTGVR